MPTAICSNDHVHTYRNPRGTKLSSIACPTCGESLHAAKRKEDDSGWERRYGAKNTGRTFSACLICGRNRQVGGVQRWPTPAGRYRKVKLPGDEVACWFHGADQVEEAVRKLRESA